MVVSIRMSDEEKELAESFAKLNGMSLSESIKKVYFKEIEDLLDIKLYEDALKNNEGKKTYNAEEAKKFLGL